MGAKHGVEMSPEIASTEKIKIKIKGKKAISQNRYSQGAQQSENNHTIMTECPGKKGYTVPQHRQPERKWKANHIGA